MNQPNLSEMDIAELEVKRETIRQKILSIVKKRNLLLVHFVDNFNINCLEMSTHYRSSLDLLDRSLDELDNIAAVIDNKLSQTSKAKNE